MGIVWTSLCSDCWSGTFSRTDFSGTNGVFTRDHLDYCWGSCCGAVQDFVILFASMRRNGKSLGEMIKDEIGPVTGLIAMIGILGIMIILLAVLALVVVKALIGSPWGMFTIAATIPIAILMGVYMRYIRPGRVGEGSVIGIILLILSLVGGQYVAENPTLASMFTFSGETIAIMLIVYGFIASALPVWMLLAPRDYLSTF